MAHIVLNRRKLQHNYRYLQQLFEENQIEWSIVTKVLCGSEVYLKEIIDLGIEEVCDSRITNLKRIKRLTPEVQTVFIKPPAKRYISKVIRYADASFNTEYETIKQLSEEAVRQNKRHKVIIMIELGELREGVMREDFIDFYARVFELPNIEITGIGTNLSCMNGVLPNQDKLIQLCLYKQLIEAKFDRNIPFISGGTSVTIPLLEQGLLPTGINHFRVGESIFLGTDVYHDGPNENLEQDVFLLYAEIIELREKPNIPDGNLTKNANGEMVQIETEELSSYRAIIDMGLLDVDENHVRPSSEHIKIVGSSSDMMVVDLGEEYEKYKVGSLIEFKMDYMGILRLMSCEYVDKLVAEA